jgi:hypothetical protein
MAHVLIRPGHALKTVQATMKTIFFEDKYKTDISQFSTTTEIDKFMENKLGRPLRVIRIQTNIL